MRNRAKSNKIEKDKIVPDEDQGCTLIWLKFRYFQKNNNKFLISGIKNLKWEIVELAEAMKKLRAKWN